MRASQVAALPRPLDRKRDAGRLDVDEQHQTLGVDASARKLKAAVVARGDELTGRADLVGAELHIVAAEDTGR